MVEEALMENITVTDELEKVLNIYIDMEKVEQDNLRDKLKKIQQQISLDQQSSSNGVGATSTLRSPKSDATSKRSHPIQSSRRTHEKIHQEQEQKKKERQQRMQQEMINADLKLHSLKDIYIDMKRNSELDFENFLRPDVIQQCIKDKYAVS